MNPFRWLRELFRPRSAPLAPHAKPLIMHSAGRGLQPECGTAYGPAAPVTVEAAAITCPTCQTIVRRRHINRRIKIR